MYVVYLVCHSHKNVHKNIHSRKNIQRSALNTLYSLAYHIIYSYHRLFKSSLFVSLAMHVTSAQLHWLPLFWVMLSRWCRWTDKLQALVYGISPLTTAITGYAVGFQKLVFTCVLQCYATSTCRVFEEGPESVAWCVMNRLFSFQPFSPNDGTVIYQQLAPL